MIIFQKIIRYIGKIFSYIIVFLIKLYRLFISPLLSPSCRYFPSCSAYSVDAFKKHGLVKGLYLSIIRIISCNPLSRGGHDPVPDTFHFFK